MHREKTKDMKERAPRKEISGKVEFLIEGDILDASSVNISDSGICINANKPLQFSVELDVHGNRERYQAHLVWAKSNPDGTMTYGLCFDGRPNGWNVSF